MKRLRRIAWDRVGGGVGAAFCAATCGVMGAELLVNDYPVIALGKNRAADLWDVARTMRFVYSTSTLADLKSEWRVERSRLGLPFTLPRFRVDRGRDGKGHRWWGVTLPDWFVTACTVPMLVPCIMTRKQKNVRGLCHACGYDIRAHPGDVRNVGRCRAKKCNLQDEVSPGPVRAFPISAPIRFTHFFHSIAATVRQCLQFIFRMCRVVVAASGWRGPLKYKQYPSGSNELHPHHPVPLHRGGLTLTPAAEAARTLPSDSGSRRTAQCRRGQRPEAESGGAALAVVVAVFSISSTHCAAGGPVELLAGLEIAPS